MTVQHGHDETDTVVAFKRQMQPIRLGESLEPLILRRELMVGEPAEKVYQLHCANARLVTEKGLSGLMAEHWRPLEARDPRGDL